MCPERQILSLYLDGELPSPWKEKMESHLAKCPDCRERLESYRLISSSISGADSAHAEAVLGEARERVWRKLEAQKRLDRRGVPAAGRSPVWRRSVSIPFPAAAAAAVLVIALGVFWIRRPAEQSTAIPQITLSSEDVFDTPAVVPVADMDGVLQYLKSKDNGDILILQLPESRSFRSSGEPAILKAADYTRSQP